MCILFTFNLFSVLIYSLVYVPRSVPLIIYCVLFRFISVIYFFTTMEGQLIGTTSVGTPLIVSQDASTSKATWTNLNASINNSINKSANANVCYTVWVVTCEIVWRTFGKILELQNV